MEDQGVAPTQGAQSKDRSRPPFPRTGSRSSTSSSRTRMTYQSAHTNPSSSHERRTLPLDHPAHPSSSSHQHRFHHNSCSTNSSSDRPRFAVSQDATDPFRQSLPPVSTFLQERLQKERKAESQRASTRLSDMSASLDLRTVQSSPLRSDADGNRPRSSGAGEVTKKAAQMEMGVKEMEKTLSSLHKQNFDLKLELYHRRERQAELEERLQQMEESKAELENINDELVAELEKRDLAIAEAVQMIVLLEAQKDQLCKERDMVKAIDANGYPQSSIPSRSESPGLSTPPKMQTLQLPKAGDAKVINRMPSFLTDMSENTENLRNVYLGTHGSVLSLQRMSLDSQRGTDSKGITSPSLSVLSESSFTSIYGQKKRTDDSVANPDLSGVDGPSENDTVKLVGDISLRNVTPHKTHLRSHSSARKGSSGSIPYQNITDVLEGGGSPLQRLEKLARREASRPSSEGLGALVSSQGSKSQALRSKKEKRDALQKVLINALPGRDFDPAHAAHALPPTPDTISTSTLRHYKNSNETLPKTQDVLNERSFLALSESTTSRMTALARDKTLALTIPQTIAAPPSTTAFESRRGLPSGHTYFDPGFGAPQLRRPRSADETTISHSRRRGLQGWESDDSFDDFNDFDDAHSVASSYDMWIREGLSSDPSKALDPLSSASQAGGRHQQQRVSPDLFSFPTTSKGWPTDSMFGVPHGKSSTPAPLADALDALGNSLPTPIFGAGFATPVLTPGIAPPPPPSRRSSLQATTGTGSILVGSGVVGVSPARPGPSNGKLRKSPVRSNRTRSNSIDAQQQPQATNAELGLRQGRASTVPPNQILQPPPLQEQAQGQAQQQSMNVPKQRHYPPNASQAPRSRGLNIFRRSVGSSDTSPAAFAPSSAPATETTFKNVPPQMVGIPSWGRRNLADDDRASATPPPIMRDRNRVWASMEDGGGGALLDTPENANANSGGAPVGLIPGSVTAPHVLQQQKPPGTSGSGGSGGGAPASPAGTIPGGNGAGVAQAGGMRKWLGLGRVGSLRNRAG